MTQPSETGSGGGTSELLSAIGQDVRALLREEVDRLRHELGTTVRSSRNAAALLGGAGGLGLAAAATSTVLVVRVLDSFLPRPVATLVATGMYGGGAVALGRAGLAELRRAREAVPSA